MIKETYIDAVLTDDESELITIISGLEEQADQLEGQIEKIRNSTYLMGLGSAAFLGLSFLENSKYEKLEYLMLSAGLVIGGISRLIKESKITRGVRSKNLLATRLKQELEPTDLERYEERDDLDFEEEDEGFY